MYLACELQSFGIVFLRVHFDSGNACMVFWCVCFFANRRFECVPILLFLFYRFACYFFLLLSSFSLDK